MTASGASITRRACVRVWVAIRRRLLFVIGQLCASPCLLSRPCSKFVGPFAALGSLGNASIPVCHIAPETHHQTLPRRGGRWHALLGFGRVLRLASGARLGLSSGVLGELLLEG